MSQRELLECLCFPASYLQKDYQSTLEEKDTKISALEKDIMDFQRAADQARVLQLIT